MSTIEPHAEGLGELALLAARAGVTAIRAATAQGISAEFKSGSHDLVTAADRGSESAIIRVIVESRPDDEILGEEGGSRTGTSGVRWLIDPLDGTANFVYGRADHAVSVGATVGGRRTVGAIVRPADGCWAMTAGSGVTFGRDRLDGRAFDEPSPTGIEPDTELAEALICFGLPYAKPARQQVLSLISSVIPMVRGVRIVGSAAGDLLAVARHEADAFVGCGLAEWDTAAGLAIVAAAGGATRKLITPDFDIVLAGAPRVVDELAHLLTDSRSTNDEQSGDAMPEQDARRQPVLVIMGVSGSGKSTIAGLLAQRLRWDREEGDDLHPSANVAKMAAGTPLTDEDRWPWLDAVSAWITAHTAAGQPGIITCSALRKVYRDRLRGDHVLFVYLRGSKDLIGTRLTARTDHYMPPSLLDSQIATLEAPGADENVLTVDVGHSPEAMAADIIDRLHLVPVAGIG